MTDKSLFANRRDVLAGLSAVPLAGLFPGIGFATVRTDSRLIVVLLRGGMDGLAAVPPVGDPSYAGQRGVLAVAEGAAGAIPLTGPFALNPALKALIPLWQAGEMTIFHAIHSSYRKRSHFDGQKLLETGGQGVNDRRDGWLNRALGGMRGAGGLAIGQSMPLIMTGDGPVTSWAPSHLPQSDEDFLSRLEMMFEGDPVLAPALVKGLKTRDLAEQSIMGGGVQINKPDRVTRLGASVAALLKAPDGPRIAAMELTGWDTHANQRTTSGPLARRFGTLATLITALKAGLGDVWKNTALIAVSEFGRTVRPNGSKGTDHGSASAAFLVGGAVDGGRIIADWPGLSPAGLLENRDLRPTLEHRSVFKGLLGDHMHVPRRHLETEVFPDSAAARPMEGLLRG